MKLFKLFRKTSKAKTIQQMREYAKNDTNFNRLLVMDKDFAEHHKKFCEEHFKGYY